MKNKFLVIAIVFSLIASILFVPNVQAKVKSFSDIPKSYIYYDIITEMTKEGYINGYEDGTFKPDLNINRQHAAVLISRVLKSKGISLEDKSSNKYRDATDIRTNPYRDDIQALVKAGLLSTNGAGRVYPTQELTRGEMAKILAVSFDLKATKKHPFKDVPKELDDYVSALYSNGVTTGYEDGTFKSNNKLSRAHYCVFMYRAIGTIKPTNPVEIPKMSMDMTYNEFVTAVEADKDLFKIDRPIWSSPYVQQAFDNPRYKKLLIEAQDIIRENGFQYRNISTYFRLEEPGHVSTLPEGFMSTQIFVAINDDGLIDFNIDYTDEKVVDTTIKLFNLVYPELNMDSIIKQKAKEARDAYAKEKYIHDSQRSFKGNSEIIQKNGYEIKIGTNSLLEFFWIDVKYIN